MKVYERLLSRILGISLHRSESLCSSASSIEGDMKKAELTPQKQQGSRDV